MNTPLISVIVPVYNAEKYLPKCLDSILAQTYKKLEIILVDDGSTDNSGKICDDYVAKDKRIKVIHKQNGGVSSARNAGLSVAKGEYIGFVDSDDYIDNDMYDYLLRLIFTSGADIARCYVYEFSHNKINTELLSPLQAIEVLYPHIYLWNMLFIRSCVGEISFDENISVGEDMKFCIDVFDNSKQIICGDEAKYHYFSNPASATKKSFNIKKLTYFNAAQYILDYAERNNLLILKQKIEGQICYHAVGFLRQIAVSDYKDKKVIKDLQAKVRKDIFKHLLGKHKISNKLFALTCCVSFLLTKKIYSLLWGEK